MNKTNDQQAESLMRLQKSIDVIKWCIVSITVIMVSAILLAVWTLNSVNKEMARVRAEVDQVSPQIAEVVTKSVEIVDGVKRLTDGLQIPIAAAKKLLRKELVARLESKIQQ